MSSSSAITSQPQDGVPVKATEQDILPNPTLEVNTTVVVYAGRPLDPAAAPSSGQACEVAKQRRPYPAASRLHVHKQVIEPNARSAKESRICPEIGGKSHGNAIDLGQQDRGMRHYSKQPLSNHLRSSLKRPKSAIELRHAPNKAKDQLDVRGRGVPDRD